MMPALNFDTDPRAAKTHFQTKGFFIEPDALSSTECDELISEAHKLAGENQALPPIVMPHRNSELFLRQLKNRKITKIMRHFLGNDIAGLQSQFFFSKPGTQGFAVHQDNFFIEAKHNAFASVWCPLVDVAVLNGCLYIFPGSNTEGLLPVEPVSYNHDDGQDRNANNEECVVPCKFKQLDVIMKKGSALFIHGNLAHGSHGNESTEHRYVSLNTYIIKGESFRAGNTAKREEIPL